MAGSFGECPQCWKNKKEKVQLELGYEKDKNGQTHGQPYCPVCGYKKPKPPNEAARV